MSLKTFVKSRTFVVQIILLVVVFLVLSWFTMLMLKVYTHHGKTRHIPDFTGLLEPEVENMVKQHKLRYHIYDSLFVPEAIPGSVISQHPQAGYKAKQGRTVYLTMAAIQPEKVMLPYVVDVSLREAQNRLENAGLKLGRVEYRPSEFINLVLDKSLNGLPLPNDTMLIKGTAIDLKVGKGLSNEMTQIPNLAGSMIDDAKRMLYNVGLNIGAQVYDRSVITTEDTLMARVWKQNPEFLENQYLGLGSTVDVWLTVDQGILFDLESIETDTLYLEDDSYLTPEE
ncbi:MAG: PASTA domain-containing protein [Prolixibacteraceae bacterium]|nr:PASTA domain-containing protein [Prolixibacteraceae bacterium]